MQDVITLACGDCKRRNYTTTRNKKKGGDRLQLKKYCSSCRKRTPHKELR